MNIRQQIIGEMKKREITRYRLHTMVKDNMTPKTVYDFVNGKSDMTANNLSVIIDALGGKLTFNTPP